MSQKVVIIGAGVGGLASAAILGKMGYEVTILEKNKAIGGRVMQFKARGFTFNMGPTWYLMPDVFERYFRLFRKKPTDFFKLKRLDPQYRIFFSHTDFVDIRSSIKDTYKVFDQIEPGSSYHIRQYVNASKNMYRIAMDEFMYKNYRRFTDLLTPAMLTAGPKLHVFENLDHYVSRYSTHEKLKKILQYFTLFLGGSPKNMPALYSLLSSVDFHRGVLYPAGGMYSVVRALESLCREYGVVIKTAQEVTHITVIKKRATGVETVSKKYPADIVLSNADYPFTEMHMLDRENQTHSASYWKQKTLAPSAFILHLGIKGKIKKLKHHNVFFAADWDIHLNQIFSDPVWPTDPSYYVCCPSKSDVQMAPRGDENMFVLVPVATGLTDTDQIRNEYADKIITHLETLIEEPLQKRIRVKRIFSAKDYQELYNSYRGTAFGLSHTLMQTAAFRPGNKSKIVRNLYYVGQYTTPGIGVPMCLISSQLVTERIRNEQ